MFVYGGHCWCRLLRTSRVFCRVYYGRDKLHKYISPRQIHMASCLLKKRPIGGNRFLSHPDDVWHYNNWDDAEWDEEQEEAARLKVQQNSADLVPDELKEKYESEADSYWDQFYSQHQNSFFKDRHWLFVQFPELASKDYIADCASNARLDAAQTLTNDRRILVEGVQGEAEVIMSPEKAKKILTESQADAGLSAQEKQENVCQGVQGVVENSSFPSSGSREMIEAFPGEHGKMRVFEVGCGVGNTVFPVLQTNKDPNLFVYCCDLSETAIQLVQEHADYDTQRCHAFVADVTDMEKPMPFPEGSLDAVILIFVLSAIHPDKMQATVTRLARYLKPGGTILFRDYGRYDLVQLRFKSGKCLSPNFYVRGDGTRVYFFTQDELRTMFTTAGLTEEIQNFQDRRLQVNRGRQLKMYRVWIQCKYRKPLVTSG